MYLRIILTLSFVGLVRSTSADDVSLLSAPASHRFPDFRADYLPPVDQYDGPLFRLSQDYPTERPELERSVRDILTIPFDENSHEPNWERYLLAVRAYCFEGNIEVGFRGQENRVRTWYHVPWQHAGDKGREGINGLTREATANAGQLATTQVDRHQTHAVAMYNALGGYTIGRVWENQFEPNPARARFPVGTIVFKVLFTQAKAPEVPYLANPVEWQAYVHDPLQPDRRKVQNLRLLQMDVMVRDDRADPTGGWVFGTYCYNGALARANPWENLVSVGLQWGNDPEVSSETDNPENPSPTGTQFNSKLRESVINPSPDLPPQHLGWGGRLNGPADNYRSSCMSCHSTAQYPVVAPQHPDFERLGFKPGSTEWMAWFRNLFCGTSFSPMSGADRKRAISTDFSLQLSIGVDNFFKWKQQQMAGYFTPSIPQAASNERVETFTPASESDAVLP